MLEDATLALRAAFVLTVTFSDDAVDGDTSVCDSIAFMDLKSRISVLLSIAKDGRRDGRSNRLLFWRLSCVYFFLSVELSLRSRKAYHRLLAALFVFRVG